MRCRSIPFLAAVLTAHLMLAACQDPTGRGFSDLASPGTPNAGNIRISSEATGAEKRRPYLKPRHYKAKLDHNSESAWGETLEVRVDNGTDVAAMIHTTGTSERLIQYTYSLENDILTEVEQLSFKLYDETGKLLKKTQAEPRVLYQFAKDGKKIRTEGSNPHWSPGEDFDFLGESQKHRAFFRSSRQRFSELVK